MFTSGSDAIASIKFDLAASQPTTGTGLDGLDHWALSGDGLTLTGSIGATAVIDAGPVGPADGGRGRDGGADGDGDAAVGVPAC